MKKRILSIVLTLCMLVSLVPLTPIVATATTSVAEGIATITLVNNCNWEDGSGYQMLLDSTATAYGIRFLSEGPLARGSDSTGEVYSAFDYKIPADAGWTRDTEAVVRYGTSQTIEIPAGIYDFCITNPTPGGSMWIVGTWGEAYSRADNFEFKAGVHYTFTTLMFTGQDGVNLVTDTTPPVITGIVDGKTYCGEVKFKVTDDVGVASVVFGERTLTPDSDGNYTIKAEGQDLKNLTVTAEDTSGNKTEFKNITVNVGHTYDWQDENGMY